MPLIEVYTGSKTVDYWLSVLQVIFMNVMDGSAPALSLFGFHFAGQLVPVWTLMMVECVKLGRLGIGM